MTGSLPSLHGCTSSAGQALKSACVQVTGGWLRTRAWFSLVGSREVHPASSARLTRTAIKVRIALLLPTFGSKLEQASGQDPAYHNSPESLKVGRPRTPSICCQK